MMIFAIIFPPVSVLLFLVSLFSLAVIAVAGTTHFIILFFCHSRYSLRTMMTVVLVLGLGVSLLVSGNAALMMVGGLMLYALVMEILLGIQQFDPLRDAAPASRVSSLAVPKAEG